MNKKLKVLVVEPMEAPYVKEIEDDLKAMQEIVGGCIETVYPFDDPVVLVCNDEGKLDGLPFNRALKDDHGETYDIIQGNFFIAGLGEEDFDSLPDDMIEKYTDLYSREMILTLPKDLFGGMQGLC